MSFLYPLGLLGLIGIPILIIIYIIKSKYTEHTVSSTYLWTLSERFLKRRKPFDKVTGIISLILQILAVTLISLALARPMISLPGAAREYCFVLDASGSMNMTDGERTRFDLAKEEIANVIDESVDGSVYSLVLVGENAQVVFNRSKSKVQAKQLLEETKAAYIQDDAVDALLTAQEFFNENTGVKTYLLTDKDYKASKNVEIIKVGQAKDNFSLSDVRYSLDNGMLTVEGNVTSHISSLPVEIALYVDGSEEVASRSTTFAPAGAPTSFQLICPANTFSEFKVKILNDDILSLDSEVCVYNKSSEKLYSTLIVSDSPFFFESAFRAIRPDATIAVVGTEEYDPNVIGYGLYIYDSFSPESLPKDGSVWIVNPQGSIEDSGFSVQSRIELENDDDKQLELTKSSTVAAQKLIANVVGKDLYLKEYVKCGLYRTFTPILTYNSNPVLFAGTNVHKNREVVFAFDIHKTNMAVNSDFVILVNNLITYSFPDIIEKVSYAAGEEMTVNIVANCEDVRVDSPSGEITYLDTSSGTAKYSLKEVGTYDITLKIAGNLRSFRVYSELPAEERAPAAEADDFSLQGEATAGGLDGSYDPLLVLLICLVVIFAADWMVYCYEKYQLR